MSGKETERYVAEIIRHEAQLKNELRELDRDISRVKRYLLTLTERWYITKELLKEVDEARTNK